MAGALRRILRFRQLAEEQARLEVEQGVQALRRASAACEQQAAAQHHQRATLAASWKPQTLDRRDPGQGAAEVPAPENAWLMEEAVLEFSGLTRMRSEQILAAESRRVEPLIDRYTELRRELRQTEQLLARQAAMEKADEDRRTQAQADEWFLQRRRRR